MTEVRDNTPSKPTEPQARTREVPLDYRLLSDAIIELNISRKNVGIYPPGHLQITKSIDRAFDVLLKLFEIREEMTLGVARDTLFVGQNYLDQKNPVYRDFALSLNGQEIAAVTFVRGLDRGELVRFHRILTTKPDAIAAAGGIAKVVADADIPHIRVTPIDYDVFHVTDKQEISGPQTKVVEKPGSGLWQDFVSHLSSGTLARPGQDEGISLKDAEQVDPLELARLLNERKLDPGLALQSYDRIISSHVRTEAEKKELTREQSETLRSLNNLLKDLHPDLRKQFLSVAFQRTAAASPAVTEEVVGGFTDDMVIEMLENASAEGREISPTLTGLLNKLSGVSPASSAKGPSPGRQPAMSQEHMNKLFSREKYESYVSEEYDATLKQLTEHAPAPGAAPIEGFPINEYLESLTDERLDFQIGRVALAFVNENIDAEDYAEFLKKIVAVVPDMLKTGNFSLLHDILETLRMHGRDKKDMAIRGMAGVAIQVFENPDFITKTVEAFALWSGSREREARGFLLALGSGVIPELLDLYSLDESPGGKRLLFDLLCNFGQAAVKEAVRRLHDPRAYYVRNLVMLIRWGWDASLSIQLRPLLKHPDHKVRKEALIALLQFKDASATAALREAISSDDVDEAFEAVSLAGRFRVADAVDLLLGKLKRIILFETDYEVNTGLIRALGDIGDPRAVPDLEKIARASWPLYPKRRDKMKVALFESLERYPHVSVAGLIRIGKQSDNERIRRACVKLGGGK